MPSKSSPTLPAGERAGEQHRQQRAHADRRGDPDSLQQVEDEFHAIGDARGESLRCRGRMTIDETPRGPGPGGETPGMPTPRSGARDIERYAGLFARRTQVMKSSAMRDLMAVTARPR